MLNVSLFSLGVFAQFKGPPVYETSTLRSPKQKNPEQEAESNLFRCMSDASLVKRRRSTGKSAAQREKERQHRFSINGHFYNYKVGFCLKLPSGLVFFIMSLRSVLFHSVPQTSIFTPCFGTPTKVCISSRMTTNQVIEQLLHKFKVSLVPEGWYKKLL